MVQHSNHRAITMDTEFDPREVEYEQEGTRLAAQARDAFFAGRFVTVTRRDIQVVAASQSPGAVRFATGRALISRRPPLLRKHYERAIAEERLPSEQIVYLFQVMCASAIFEAEVKDLLAEPLRPVAGVFASAARAYWGKDAEKTAAFLDKWGAGKEPTTLYLVKLGLLRTLRHGLARERDKFAPILDRAFAPELVAALEDERLGTTFHEICEARNGACHATREFDETAYRQFVARLVGNRGLTEWERDGPAPAPPTPDAGFLHGLLSGSRLLPPVELDATGTALDRLTELAAPRAAGFALELVPYVPAAGRRFRDVAVEAVRAEPGFRLGGELVVRMKANRDCHVALIDLGTSGAVSLLLPNALCPRPVLAGGASAYFPGPGFADFTFTLTGLPGRERLIALATADPLPGLPVPGLGGTFAPLSDADIDRIATAVRALPGERWSAAACEFTIEE